MLSIPPATITSWCPHIRLWAAIIMDFMPEAQTLLMVVVGMEFGRPAPSAAWRVGACLKAAPITFPINTSPTSAYKWIQLRVNWIQFDTIGYNSIQKYLHSWCQLFVWRFWWRLNPIVVPTTTTMSLEMMILEYESMTRWPLLRANIWLMMYSTIDTFLHIVLNYISLNLYSFLLLYKINFGRNNFFAFIFLFKTLLIE